MRSWRSTSVERRGGASMLSSVKCALRFLRMRKVERLHAPVFVLGDLAAEPSMTPLNCVGQFLDLLRADVLARQIDVLV